MDVSAEGFAVKESKGARRDSRPPDAGARQVVSGFVRESLRRGAPALLLVCCLFISASPVSAEQAWMKGAPLNLRSGPDGGNRIIGYVKTGEAVTILERKDSWTKVRLKDSRTGKDKEGWIREGYLNAVAPPTIRLEHAESRVAQLDAELTELRESTEKLRSNNTILSTQDGEQQSKIKQLTMENMELRAGARYPEWIAGACIFAAGMILGAILHRNSARRQPSRIRL